IKILSMFFKINDKNSIFVYGEYEILTLILETSNEHNTYNVKNIKASFINSFKYPKISSFKIYDLNSIDVKGSFISPLNLDFTTNIDNQGKKTIEGFVTSKLKINFYIDKKDTQKELSLIKKTTAIETLVVVGFGEGNLLVTNELDLFNNSPAIFKIISNSNEIKIEKAICIGEVVLIDGYINFSFQYASLEKYQLSSTLGAVYFLNYKCPFSISIDIKTINNNTILPTDTCSLIKATSENEIINLADEKEVYNNLFVYKKIITKTLIKIKLAVIRNEAIKINTY
ncbi:hypothetical protein K4H51_12445, partial [Clostridium chauvoei]